MTHVHRLKERACRLQLVMSEEMLASSVKAMLLWKLLAVAS